MPELTPTTTRREYLAGLAESYARTARNGGNRAILAHVVKIQDMDDADWPAHRAERLAAQANPALSETARSLAVEFAELPFDRNSLARAAW